MDTLDPPCDFAAFVAERRKISCEHAERLIESWLIHYRPRSQAPILFEAEPLAERDRSGYDVCA
jgi:hypothetical protein